MGPPDNKKEPASINAGPCLSLTTSPREALCHLHGDAQTFGTHRHHLLHPWPVVCPRGAKSFSYSYPCCMSQANVARVHRPRLPGSHLPSTLGAVPLHDPVRDGTGWVQHAPDTPVPVYLSHARSLVHPAALPDLFLVCSWGPSRPRPSSALPATPNS